MEFQILGQKAGVRNLNGPSYEIKQDIFLLGTGGNLPRWRNSELLRPLSSDAT